MKVKLTQANEFGNYVGEIIEVSEGKGDYMIKNGQATLVEEDSKEAHDMGSIPESGNGKKPEKIKPKIKD